jgi:actin-related protein 8
VELDLPEIERFEVKIIVREDVRPIGLSWTGASVLPKTESMAEMWISRNKWLGDHESVEEDEDADPDKKVIRKEKDKEKSNEWGLKHLKEKIPFVW